MQITNEMFPIWGRALLHNNNAEITLDHPLPTKQFVWIKKYTPKLTELAAQGQAPEDTNNKEPPKDTSPLPDVTLGEYPRDPSPLPNNRLKDLDKEPTPVTPAPSSDVKVVRRKAKLEDTCYESPISLDSSQARSHDGTPLHKPISLSSLQAIFHDGTPSHKFSCSPSDARSPTGDLIGEAVCRLSVERGQRAHRVPLVSPIRKQPGLRGSLTPQKTRIILAAGRAFTWDKFLAHCSFLPTDMAPRGLIQLNHIPHWSFFLTTSVPSLMKMICPFPEATAHQFMYGTYTMPPKYFETN
ncbi:hypothetical protein PCASD_12662 [Puccinia coronata f. sp. avenae]|uniref:Uncharacterized protein n=1 Tax=Puccinia coronata f. sp. avenae TaxID=200324 RepID=A0A2N5UAQ1_9BASI|nr:hypothetical protein PCASD_12662 [Puccinia coronata f. sp. avenae]